MSKLLVLIGRSCVGKDTIQKILTNEYGMERVATCTTRPPRNDEVDGVDYHFVNSVGTSITGTKTVNLHEDPSNWNHHLAECTEYHVASGETWYYGSLVRDYINSDNKVIILNPEGLKAVRKMKIPVFAVEISSPDKDIKERQKLRGDDPLEAERRFEQDKIDFANSYHIFDTCVINWGEGGPDRCARNIYDLYQYWLERNGEKDVED